MKKTLSLIIILLIFTLAFFPATSITCSKTENQESQDFMIARMSFDPFTANLNIIDDSFYTSIGSEGPLGRYLFGIMLGLKVTLQVEYGPIDVKPISGENITLFPGDTISINILRGWQFSNWDLLEGIVIIKGIGVTVETNSDSSG